MEAAKRVTCQVSEQRCVLGLAEAEAKARLMQLQQQQKKLKQLEELMGGIRRGEDCHVQGSYIHVHEGKRGSYTYS